MPSLEDSLASYIKAKLRDATEVRVDQLEQISGGASRQTYRFRLSYRESGFSRERRLILRLDPSGSLIDTDRRIEFAAYKAFFAPKFRFLRSCGSKTIPRIWAVPSLSAWK